jgi:hypothetical protein
VREAATEVIVGGLVAADSVMGAEPPEFIVKANHSADWRTTQAVINPEKRAGIRAWAAGTRFRKAGAAPTPDISIRICSIALSY